MKWTAMLQRLRAALLLAFFFTFCLPVPAHAYIEAPFSLGKVIQDSTNVLVMRVESVDREKNLIVYSKVADLKGKHNGDRIQHNIGRGGFNPREWQAIMAWAEVGQTAIFFHNGGAGECCINGYWYQCYAGAWWNMSHGEPYLLRSCCGKPEKLVPAITAILAGQEAIVPCMVDGDKMALQLRTARIQRMKASLKIQDYNPARDFAGWGVEEFRALAGMPGFQQYSALARTSPEAGGVAPIDFDGDGKMDFCLYGAAKVVLLQNAGGSLNEVPLAEPGGARAAAWADYNGDGKPDLLLATPTGARLYLNAGGGTFKDATGVLPRGSLGNFTAAEWLDYDGDGKPDILLASGFHGLRLYRNLGLVDGGPIEVQSGKWKIIGPFENADGQGVAAVYPPEQKIDFAAEYPGKNGEKAVWKDLELPEGQVTSVKVFRDENHAFMTVYLTREIAVNRATELPIALGSGGPLTVWINGAKVHSDNEARSPAPDQVRLKLKLNAGKNTLLIKACYVAAGRSLCFSATPPESASAPQFEDVSDKVGLGLSGIAGKLKGDRLVLADVDGDGRADFLYCAGNGVLVLNKKEGLVEVKESGLTFRAGGITPVFGDFDGDKAPDLFVPQSGGGKLFRNIGKGRFTDVTAKAGALAAARLEPTCAVWADFNRRGKLDLIVGCLRGPNRYFRNNGDGTFTDASEEIGFFQRIFNTRGVAAFDLNKDGVLDLVFNNEGQESSVLIGDPQRGAAPVAAR
jgi:hypothetical protein